MKKKYLILLSIFTILAFTCCSVDRDSFSEKPTPIDTHKPPTSYPGDNFDLFLKDHIVNSDVYGEGEILQNQNNNPRFLFSKRKWQGIPSIGEDRLGNLYAGWISGGTGESNENYLTISVSKDKGQSWDHDKLILAVTPEDSTRMKDPNFFKDKFGNLYLYWGKHVQKKNIAAKEWASTWYSKINLSDDGNTINFSSPRKIVEGIMMNKLFYSEFSDQVVFPVARWYEGNYQMHKPFIYKASYGNESLVDFKKTGAIQVPVAVSQIHEHMVVQLKDSTYLGMVRTKDGIYYSKSKDGDTWDNSIKFTDLGATTPSRFYLGKLKSGRLVFIFNNDVNRSNMTVCLSEDDGLTWPYKILLDSTIGTPGGYGISYPDMIETDPGVLNIVYDYLRAPVGGIVLIKINEEDIINNRAVFFKSNISSLK